MIELETDVVGKMLARLPRNMRKVNWQKLITIEGEQKQELQIAIFQVLLERTLEVSVGAQMDMIGKLVGQPRSGQTDDQYRPYLRARVATNNSEGTVEDLIKVITGVLGTPIVPFNLRQVFPKTIDVRVLEETISFDLADILIGFLADSKEGAVRVRLHHITGALANSFTLGYRTSVVGIHFAGITTINVASTSEFPTSGQIRLPSETLAYTSKNATQFLGVTATSFSLNNNDPVKEPLDSDVGFGDNTDPLVGGLLSSAVSG